MDFKTNVRFSKMGIVNEEKVKEILTFISKAPDFVSGVIAKTGSGKSTTLAEAIARNVNVLFVVEPTNVTVDGLVKYMKTIKDLDVGSASRGDVKYSNEYLGKIRGQSFMGRDTNLVYCTAGHIVRIFIDLIRYYEGKDPETVPGISFANVLMLDEAHIGTLDIETTMLLWKRLRDMGYPVPQLVLSSATLNISETPFPDAPTILVDTKSYPVTIEYSNKSYNPGDRALYQDTGRKVFELNRDNPVVPNQKSKWLVFAPGSAEINWVIGAMQNAPNMEVYKITSDTNLEERNRALAQHPDGIRIVIIATNIAEMGVTIENLEMIFDTMTEKLEETSQFGGSQLRLDFISKASAAQRAGRTGRTAPGKVLRMNTQQKFEKFRDYRLREIERVPLSSMIIRLMGANIDPNVLYGDVVKPVRIKNSIKMLERLSAIRLNKVTEFGNFAANSQLGVRSSASIWQYAKMGKENIYPIVVIMLMIENFGNSYFYYPKKNPNELGNDYNERMDVHYETNFSKYNAPTDIQVLINLWNDIYEIIKNHDNKGRALSAVRIYAKNNSLNNRNLSQLINAYYQLIPDIWNRMYPGIITYSDIRTDLEKILKEVYSDRIMNLKFGKYFPINSSNRKSFYRLSTKNKLKRDLLMSQKLIALYTFSTASGKNKSNFIQLTFPLVEKVKGVLMEALKIKRPVEKKENEPMIGLQLPPVGLIVREKVVKNKRQVQGNESKAMIDPQPDRQNLIIKMEGFDLPFIFERKELFPFSAGGQTSEYSEIQPMKPVSEIKVVYEEKSEAYDSVIIPQSILGRIKVPPAVKFLEEKEPEPLPILKQEYTPLILEPLNESLDLIPERPPDTKEKINRIPTF